MGSNIYSKRLGLGSGDNSAAFSVTVPAGETWIVSDVDGETTVDTAVLQLAVNSLGIWTYQAHIVSPTTIVGASWRGRIVLSPGDTFEVFCLGAWSAQASGYVLQGT